MKRLLLCPLVLFLAGCADSTAPEVTPRMAKRVAVDAVRLENGRQAYVEHCRRCHEGTPPGSTDPAYWRTMLPHMQRNSSLAAADEADLLNYLVAACADRQRED